MKSLQLTIIKNILNSSSEKEVDQLLIELIANKNPEKILSLIDDIWNQKINNALLYFYQLLSKTDDSWKYNHTKQMLKNKEDRISLYMCSDEYTHSIYCDIKITFNSKRCFITLEKDEFEDALKLLKNKDYSQLIKLYQ